MKNTLADKKIGYRIAFALLAPVLIITLMFIMIPFCIVAAIAMPFYAFFKPDGIELSGEKGSYDI